MPRRFRRLALESLEQRLVLAAESVSLTLSLDGQPLAIPANVGVAADQSQAIAYTTAGDGRVYFEPGTGVTLGDFFDTWRSNAGLAGNFPDATFDDDELLGQSIDAENSLLMFVNGQPSVAFDEYLLQPNDQISLVLGVNPVVSLNTNFGPIVIELFPEQTPLTVANFLNYVNDGDYDNSFFHRSDPGFVVQGGGFRTLSTTFFDTALFTSVPTDAPVQNEPGISNLTGTVAMAKLGGQPNSATSQFFVNLADNTGLNTNNGGFTVFGRVLDMTTVRAIEALPVDTSNPPPYGELPLSETDQLVVVQSVAGLGFVSGVKYRDADGDGQRDEGEAALAGATVYVDANANGALDDGEAFALTDDQGRYRIATQPGAVTVRTVPAAGTTPTGDATHAVTVTIGREEDSLDFGERVVALADVYATANEQQLVVAASAGVLANDPGDGSSSPTVQVATQPEHGTLTLNADGSFTYVPDADFIGQDTFQYAYVGAQTSSPIDVTLNVGPLASSSLAGFVYVDVDGDGQRGPNEPGAPGVQITLNGTSATGGSVEQSVLTDDDGAFLFDELAAGTYQLRQRQPTLLRDGQDGASATGVVVENDLLREIALAANQQLTGFRFGERSLAAGYASLVWQFASTARDEAFFRSQTADAEEYAGYEELAAAIRAESDPPSDGDSGDGNTGDGDSGDGDDGPAADFSVSRQAPAGTLVGNVAAPANSVEPVVFQLNTEEVDPLLELVPDDHRAGDAAAPLMLVEYLDLQCPSCRAVHDVLQEIKVSYGDDLLVVPRYFPLSVHEYAEEAAWAAEAAGRQGQFDAMVDLLFDQQTAWAAAADDVALDVLMINYGLQLGLNIEQFNADRADAALRERVARDRSSAVALGVASTPAFYLNGSPLVGAVDVDDFEAALTSALTNLQESLGVDRDSGSLFVRDTAALAALPGDEVEVDVVVRDAAGGRAVVTQRIALTA